MKKYLVFSFFVLYTIITHAQWNSTGNNSSTGSLSIGGNINLVASKFFTARPGDGFTYDDQAMDHYALRWGHDSWRTTGGYTLWLSSYGGIKFFTAGTPRFTINNSGYVGIGTTNPTALLSVNGTIRSKEVKIEATGWSDFVFAPDYRLPTLSEVERYIKEKQHLPDVPSEKEVIENGISVGAMQAKLLQKIEELTLYVIDLKKENEEIKKKLEDIKR
ncbi:MULTISPECIES: hypothetical protein [unclassified Dysgonomonas]|jgi:hypothetical protein|uniref:hypothetical protein n=1 Tax=unclassified Dysgonomonas TaxID=2630389 RepID=UPI0025C166F9|nr:MULTISPECIES: hypothetical protein [unclassified Dysgonomonas]MDR2004515.1 hypothetical protein [Prevotella sp.]HMM03766.1 hypothetical protein [Dysgonomonas sp.]